MADDAHVDSSLFLRRDVIWPGGRVGAPRASRERWRSLHGGCRRHDCSRRFVTVARPSRVLALLQSLHLGLGGSRPQFAAPGTCLSPVGSLADPPLRDVTMRRRRRLRRWRVQPSRTPQRWLARRGGRAQRRQPTSSARLGCPFPSTSSPSSASSVSGSVHQATDGPDEEDASHGTSLKPTHPFRRCAWSMRLTVSHGW